MKKKSIKERKKILEWWKVVMNWLKTIKVSEKIETMHNIFKRLTCPKCLNAKSTT